MAKRLLAITVILLAALADWAQCPDFTFQYTGIAVNRHTVITQQGTDPGTNFQLPFLPPGESAVVRLGNNTGGEAEAITYQFTVDPDHSILLVKFAVVLEDPHHMFWDQPRFVMRVIDSVGNLVSSCSEYDVRAGWEIPGVQSAGNVRWRPWTNFGLDLTEYAGQQIRVQFITYEFPTVTDSRSPSPPRRDSPPTNGTTGTRPVHQSILRFPPPPPAISLPRQAVNSP